MVKFTQELTDTQPANAGSDCGSNYILIERRVFGESGLRRRRHVRRRIGRPGR